MAEDKNIRQYLLGTVVTILIGAGGCTANQLLKRIDTVEAATQKQEVEGAVIKQDLRNFRQSFEDFKSEWKKDDERHHQRPDR
jgi:ABC-type phosphate transport system ATPase subunit